MGPLAQFLLALTNLVRSGIIRNIPTALKAAEREFGKVTPLLKKQIERISQSLRSNNYTMVPLNLHFNNKGFLKMELSISKGRKKADLREYKKQQDWKKEKQRL